MDFKYLVVGGGIMGSAAAMHLASATRGVALLGPTEDMADEDPSVPKGSHYDAGRITRVLDPDFFWGGLAARSIERYRAIEHATQIRFFNECGFLWLDSDAERANNLKRLASDGDEEVEQIDAARIQEQFPFLSANWIAAAIYQSRTSGTINPRAYVQAMQTRAKGAGAEHICDHAIRLELTTKKVKVHSAARRTFSAEKVLVATGAYGAIDRLLGRKLPLKACKTGVVLVEVADDASGLDLANMPSIVSRPPTNRPNTYLLPPLKYPDGKFYLKIGSAVKGPPVNGIDELNRWLREGRDCQGADLMLAEVGSILPRLSLAKWRYLSCVTCHTKDTRPIIDVIEDGRIGLLLAGNGYAAKSGDALGELGAALMLGNSWPGPIPREDLALARFGG